MERARMIAYLELDREHTLDSSSFISSNEYNIALGTLCSLNPDVFASDSFKDKHKIDFRELDYRCTMYTFVLDKHQYFYFSCLKNVGWEGDVDIDSQCYVKVDYRSIEEVLANIKQYIPEVTY